MSKIKLLSDKITKARHDYYNGTPAVSDAVFDAWIDELAVLDPNHLAVVSIGAPPVTEWKKVDHVIPMGSLNKVNTKEEFKTWANKCSTTKFLLTEKLDGLSISTEWKNGELIQAVTRGSGSTGEDITANVKRFGFPKKLKKDFTGYLRGEIILKRSTHKEYFPQYSNPRNAASGISRRYDGDGSQHLTIQFYAVEGIDFKTELDQFSFINSLGLESAGYKVCDSIEEVYREYDKYQNTTRDRLDWEIDGLVFKVLDLAQQEALGEENHRPKGQIAFKFAAAAKETIIRKITWQVGNSGRITPVADFDMVELTGAKIERCSLHNYSNVVNLALDIGATVLISRANDVIPYLSETIITTGTIAKYPKNCPECAQKTQFNGEYLICDNTLCPAAKLGRLMIWVNEHNILDFSEATLQRFIDAGLVNDVEDLYKLQVASIEKLDRMGLKLAKKLVEIIDSHREITLAKFIGALGIPNVGTTTSALIVDSGFDNLDKMYNVKASRLEGISGLGPVKAAAFVEGIALNRNRIDNILKAGVRFKTKTVGSLTGKSFCFTGESSLPRAQLHKLVEENGGMVKKSVGKGLDYLVMANQDSTSSKAQNAQKLGTSIITEKTFMGMI